MYQLTVKPKEPKKWVVLLLLIACVLAEVGVFFAFLLFVPAVNPSVMTLVVLLAAFVIFYLIARRRDAVYLYDFDGSALRINQSIGRGTVKETVLDKHKLTPAEPQRKCVRLYPAGQTPCYFSDGKTVYAMALDEAMCTYLTQKEATDAFIEVHREEMTGLLSTLIAIPSVKSEAEDGMPFGRSCAEVLEKTLACCEELGMKTHNVDNYCGWAEIGEGEKMLGILCHLDVMPAGDGWKGDAFTPRREGDLLFGRGAIDDKGPSVAAIYAVAAVKAAAEKSLACRIRLIFGCDEESGWACMDRYRQSEEMPAMAFTPDASYPVIIGEKGIAHIALHTSLTEGAYQLYLQGGRRANMVPDEAHATVIGDMAALSEKLNAYEMGSHGLCFTIKDDTLEIDSTGISAHGSTPESGKNAFFELFRLLEYLDLGGSQGELVSTLMRLLTDKTDGSGLSLALKDEFSGALTVNWGLGYIGKNDLYPAMNDDSVLAVLDIRFPVSYSLQDITARLESAIPSTWECEVLHAHDPLAMDKDSPLVQVLMEVYRTYTGREDEPEVIGGGTYARAFPGRAVAFGMVMPGREETAHQPNEYIALSDMILSAEMFASAIKKLAE